MFTAKINGVRLLADGNVTVMLTCNGDNLQSIANSRKGEVTVYSAGEAPVTDNRTAILSNIRSLAEQVAEAIDRELNQVDEDYESNIGLMTAMEFDKESGR